MQEAEVQIRAVSKSYPKVKAINDITLDIQPGELFGFIGPDGAGKTTLFRIMASLLLPDAGQLMMMGFDVAKQYKAIRTRIGYMPGRFSLYQDLTVEENLRFFAGVHGTSIKENYSLIRDIYQQIEPFKNRPAGKLSGGMKQKLALSCALIHKPKVLLLDEPTTGVDAVSRQEFWLMLKNLQKQGITIIVSTPYMDEATLCDRVALIQKGQLLDVASPEHVIASFGHRLFAIKSADMFNLPTTLSRLPNTKAVYRYGDSIHYVPEDEFVDEMKLEKLLHQAGEQGVQVRVAMPSVEDCFILHLHQQP